MTLLLIPVAYALPAVQAHLERWPDDDGPKSREQMRDLCELFYGFNTPDPSPRCHSRTRRGGSTIR